MVACGQLVCVGMEERVEAAATGYEEGAPGNRAGSKRRSQRRVEERGMMGDGTSSTPYLS